MLWRGTHSQSFWLVPTTELWNAPLLKQCHRVGELRRHSKSEYSVTKPNSQDTISFLIYTHHLKGGLCPSDCFSIKHVGQTILVPGRGKPIVQTTARERERHEVYRIESCACPSTAGKTRSAEDKGSFQLECHPPINSSPEAEMTRTYRGTSKRPSRGNLWTSSGSWVEQVNGRIMRGCEARMKLVEFEGADTAKLMWIWNNRVLRRSWSMEDETPAEMQRWVVRAWICEELSKRRETGFS